ncbi:MAG: efflux RND transporter permease subunit, partial [Myxococcota bacterium]
RSYIQPMVVMSAIPFGIVGAVAGHLIMGYDLSLISVFGIVAVSGIVVNDSLVLVHAANERRNEGHTSLDAIQWAGRRRFRPIILTSLTTFFGLMPMILETSVQARFLIPMAISLAFGILFATSVILLLVPSLYMVVEDLRGLFARDPSAHPARHPPSSGFDVSSPPSHVSDA